MRGIPEPAELFGSYLLLRELGWGGQGTVWLAEDRRLKRRVALKLLKGAGSASHDQLRRFQRESQAASRLDHPNICGLLDAGEVDGVSYLALRFVEGESLAVRIARAYRRREGMAESSNEGGPPSDADPDPSSRLGIGRLVTLFEKVARALHTAHEHGLVHRDIKPGNLMVTPDGEPVVLDFGLARDELTDEPSLTVSGDLLGTPAYMSPEQLLAQRVPLDRRTDVYSLGATLYECLTLEKPFAAATRAELYQRILHTDPTAVGVRNRQIPRDLQIVVETATEKDRNRRYQTALDLAEDLRRVREREPILARPIGRLLRLGRWAQRHPASSVGLASLVLGLVVALGFLRQQRIEVRIREALMASLDAMDSRATDALASAIEAVELGQRPETLSQLQSAVAQQFRVAEVQAHVGMIRAIAWCARYQVLMTAGQDGARLWAREGKSFRGHSLLNEPVHGGSFSPDGDRVLTVSERGARIWTWQGELLCGPLAGSSSMTSGVWLGGDRVVTAQWDGSVSLWDIHSSVRLEHREGHHAGFAHVWISTADGRVVTDGSDGAFKIWQVDSGSIASCALGERVSVVACDPAGARMFAGGMNGACSVWSSAGVEEARWRGHRDSVWAATFSADGTSVLTGSEDSTARLWDTRGEPMGVVARHSGTIFGAEFVANGTRVLTWAGDGAVALWSDSGKLLLRLGSDSVLGKGVMCGDGTLATCSWNGQLAFWDLAGRHRTFLCMHEDRVWDMDFDMDGRLTTVSYDGSICLWSRERRLLWKRQAGAPLLSVCFSGDGKRLLTGNAWGDVETWDVERGARLQGRRVGDWALGRAMRSIVRSPQRDRFVITTYGGSAFLANASLSDVRKLELRSGATRVRGAWSGDGRWIGLTMFTNSVVLLRADGSFEKELQCEGGPLSTPCFDPQGDRILVSSLAGNAYLFDFDGNCIVTYPGDVMLNFVVFSPDGALVATARKNGTAQLWTRAGELICTLREPVGQVTTVRFSPDGRWMVTASSEGTVRFWPADMRALLTTARDQLAAMGR